MITCGNRIVTLLGTEDCNEKAVAGRVVDGLVTNLCKTCAEDHDHRDHRLDRAAPKRS